MEGNSITGLQLDWHDQPLDHQAQLMSPGFHPWSEISATFEAARVSLNSKVACHDNATEHLDSKQIMGLMP